MRKTFAATLLVFAFAAVPASAQEYIALGDSITFGETDLRYVPSDGKRGYVADFANIIAARTGTAPDVVNLAIDGETASSFFTGFGRTPPVQGRGDLDLALQNTNHSSPSPLSQSATFLADAAAAKAAGRTIDTVSISLGFNELAAPEAGAIEYVAGLHEDERVVVDDERERNGGFVHRSRTGAIWLRLRDWAQRPC